MTLCPTDEGAVDPDFAAYRRRLLAAVERKDEAALLPLVAVNIRVDFGGGGGIDDFRKQWSTGSPDSLLWVELRDVLERGGSFIGEEPHRSFWAPYVYSRWPDDVDAFEHAAVIRSGAPLRRDPGDEAPSIRTLDWLIVRVTDPPTKEAPVWHHVRTADGTEGWVRATDVRSPIGYRAGFDRVKGEWRMTAFVAGD